MSDHRLVALVGSFTKPSGHTECSCGWSGPNRTNVSDALADHTEHVDSARADDTAGRLTGGEISDDNRE